MNVTRGKTLTDGDNQTDAAQKILCWNINRRSNSEDQASIVQLIKNLSPDIAILTEASINLPLDDNWHIASSEPVKAMNFRPDERKVMILSRDPFEYGSVSVVGPKGAPQGRFVAVRTFGLNVLGILPPHRDFKGPRSGNSWQGHMAFTEHLGACLERYSSPVIVAGDFNLEITKHGYSPHKKQLMSALEGFEIITSECRDSLGKRIKDHIAVKGVNAMSTNVFPHEGVSDKPIILANLDGRF